MSRGIAVARVICIFCVMFVHTWPSNHRADLTGIVSPAFQIIQRLMVDVLGRSSVPLLSIVSGYLLASSINLRWRRLIGHRVRTLLLPLLLWNAVMVAVLIAGRGIDPTPWYIPRNFISWTNTLLALQQPSANVPVAFLRDLFVCILFAPVLLALARRGKPATLLLLALLAGNAAFDLTGVLLIRPMILLFFATGIALRVHGIDVGHAIARPWAIALALLLAAATVWGHAWLAAFAAALGPVEPTEVLIILLRRFAVAYLFWCAALALTGTWLGARLRDIEPFIFLVFCSHAVTFSLLSPIGRALVGGINNPLYPLYFFAQPVLALGIGIVGATALARTAPRVASWFNAGRVPPRRLPWQPASAAPHPHVDLDDRHAA